MKHTFFLFLMLFLAASDSNCRAQQSEDLAETSDWDSFVETFMEMGDENALEESWDEEILEDLYEIYCEKINLNNLKKEQLEQLPFLSENQILEIMKYVEQNRPLISTGELMQIPSLDFFTRKRFQLFCVAGPVPDKTLSLSQLLQKSQHEIVLRSDIPFYTKMGFAHYPASVLEESPNKVYLGSRWAGSLRYKMKGMEHLEAGFQLEKDVGEKGIDYWAAYALLKKVGCIEKMVVGDYRLSFGLGLAVNTSTGFGKTMMMNTLGRLNQGIRAHSSTQESEYFKGVAATLRLSPDFRLSAFASYRKADGTFLADSSGISNLKTDGLHRTQLERSKDGNLSQTNFGGNVEWYLGRFLLTATTAYTHYSTPLRPIHNTPSTRYRLYNAAGSDFLTSSLGYSYSGNSLHFVGETAMDRQGHLATLNTFQADFGSNTLTLIQRYYQAKFVSVLGKTFGESSRPQNECGVLAGWRQAFTRKLTLDSYIDVVYFPWMRYQVNHDSWCVEGMATLDYSLGKGRLVNLRYRIKHKQNTVHSLRSQFIYPLSPTLFLKTMLAASFVADSETDTKCGLCIGGQATWKNSRKWKVTLGATYFHTDSYDSRIYGYEPSLLYAFGMHSYNGEGCRLVMLANIPFLSRLHIICKLSSTRYFDRSVVGTGLDLIPHKHREDLQLQLQWKF